MNTRKIDSEIKMNQWIEIVRECRNSGQSVRSWCIEHNVDEKRYYYWLRKIRTTACNTLPIKSEETHQIVPLKVEELNLEAITSTQATAIVLHLNSAIVEIRNEASSSVIENTLRAIKNLC